MGDTQAPDCRYGLVQAASRLTTRAHILSKSSSFRPNVSLLVSSLVCIVTPSDDTFRVFGVACGVWTTGAVEGGDQSARGQWGHARGGGGWRRHRELGGGRPSRRVLRAHRC